MLRFLFILLIIYLAFRYIIKPLLKMYLQRTIRNAVDKEMQRQGGSPGRQRKEGSISIDYIPDKEKNRPPSRPKDDEYIDYEDIR